MTATNLGMTRAGKNIRWIEKHCRIPEGKFVGQKVKLRPWQKKWVIKIYDNPHVTRTVIITVGKKNGKTSFAAFLLLLHIAGPEVSINSQLYSTALSREQAATIFKLAAQIVRLSPTLRKYVIPGDSAKTLSCPRRGTNYAALSAEAKTAHGKSPKVAVHDELGEVKGPRSALYDAVEDSMGAHDDPLSFIISTQAATDDDLLSRLIDDALKINDPRVVLIIHVADEDLDPFSVKALKQANPAYGDFLSAKEAKRKAGKARRMPSYESVYRNYTLNQRVETSNPFVTKTVWQANGDEIGPGNIIFGGLDLSETNDLTALILVSPTKNLLSVESIFWLPEEGLKERSRLDRVTYDVWADQGFLQTTPGRSVEYEFVAHYLAELFDERNIRKICFDRWNMRHLRPWLIKAGLSESFIDDRFIDFGQGFKSMSPALRNLESLLLNNKLRHGNHPVLTMCAANCIVKMDEAGGRKFDKKRARGRIDGMLGLVMACAVASEENASGPVYPVDLERILEDIHA